MKLLGPSVLIKPFQEITIAPDYREQCSSSHLVILYFYLCPRQRQWSKILNILSSYFTVDTNNTIWENNIWKSNTADICMTFMEKGSYKRHIFVTKICDVDMVFLRVFLHFNTMSQANYHFNSLKLPFFPDRIHSPHIVRESTNIL